MSEPLASVIYGGTSYSVPQSELENVRQQVKGILESTSGYGFIAFDRPDGGRDGILITSGIPIAFHDARLP